MMGYLLLLIVILNGSFFLSFITKKRFENTAFLSIGCLVIPLFFFGFFNILNIGVYFVITLSILEFIANSFIIFKRKKPFDYFLTPGLFAFLIFYLILIWTNYGRLATVWDEFSHWLLVVKNMYIHNNFALGSESNLVFKSYLSCSAIFQYFAVKISSSFNEGLIFNANGALISSLLLPVFNRFELRDLKKPLFYIILPIVFLTPCLLYADTYFSLYVDALLGVLCFNILFTYFTSSSNRLDTGSLLYYTIAFAMLLMAKEIGLILTLMCYCIIGFDQLFIKNKFKFNHFIKENYKYFITIIPAFVIKYMWGYLMIHNGITNAGISGSKSVIMKNVMALFSGNNVGYKSETMRNFIEAIFNKQQLFFPINISYFALSMFFLLFGYILLSTFKDKIKKRSVLVLFGFTFAGAIGYALVILIFYLSVFSEYEAVRLASFPRYMGSYSMVMVLLTIFLLIYHFIDKKIWIVLTIIIVLSIQCQTVLNLAVPSIIKNRAVQTRTPYMNAAKLIKKNVKENDKILLISRCSKGYDYWVLRYEITPIKSNEGKWSIGKSCNTDDIWSTKYSDADFIELIKSYDYVYIYKTDEYFNKTYGRLLIKEDLKQDALYEVDDAKLYYVESISLS